LKISTQHQEASWCPSSGLGDSHPDPVKRLAKLEASPLDGDASTDAMDGLLQMVKKAEIEGKLEQNVPVPVSRRKVCLQERQLSR
jgi:hypothetical protein